MYATKADVAAYMVVDVTTLPANVDSIILSASNLIDQITLGNIDGTNVDHVEAARNATSAQVQYWIENGETDKFAIPSGGSLNVGPLTVSGSFPIVSPRTKRLLFTAGLLFRGVRTV